MRRRNSLPGLIARTESAAEQHLVIALHAAGAHLAVGRVVDGHRFHAVEHEGRRLAVVLTRDADRDAALDQAGWAVYVVSASLCATQPQRAAGDVLAAVRERGTVPPQRVPVAKRAVVETAEAARAVVRGLRTMGAPAGRGAA